MKTLHRLYIYPDTIDRDARDRAATFLSIPEVLTIKNSFRRDPDILNNLVLESDADIDERSLTKYVSEPGFHQIHLVLSDEQWRELGLRPSLYSQSRTVNGQVITYGASNNRRSILSKYSAEIQAVFTEDTLMEWHEAHHGIAPMLGIMNPTTHAAFYGYKEADSHLKDSRRWVRKPYPLQAWQQLPWHLLPERTPRWVVLDEQLAKTQFNVLTFVGQLLKNMVPRMTVTPTLFAAAREYLGRDASPNDVAPDLLGCAESVTNIIQDVLPDFPIITGTWTLWDKLENDERFKRVTIPMPGDIIISPTGTVKDAPFPGHVGIFGRDGYIMSNNSYTGLWEESHSLEGWNLRYKDAGYQVLFYKLIK